MEPIGGCAAEVVKKMCQGRAIRDKGGQTDFLQRVDSRFLLPPDLTLILLRHSRQTPLTMAPDQHHHRSTTKQSHKPYKSKHMSKGAIKDKNKGMLVSTLSNVFTANTKQARSSPCHLSAERERHLTNR